MPFSLRFKTSFILYVLLVFVLAIADMLFALNLADVLLSPWFAVAAVGVAWFLAPWVAERLPYK